MNVCFLLVLEQFFCFEIQLFCICKNSLAGFCFLRFFTTGNPFDKLHGRRKHESNVHESPRYSGVACAQAFGCTAANHNVHARTNKLDLLIKHAADFTSTVTRMLYALVDRESASYGHTTIYVYIHTTTNQLLVCIDI